MSHDRHHPLPAEWLRRLGDALSPADQRLLAACPHCRATVDQLRAADLQSLREPPRPSLRPAVPPQPREPERVPSRGDIWAIGFDGDLAVVLSAPRQLYGERWWTVMAIDEEDELTASDALLRPDESSMSIPMRVRTSLQAAVPRLSLRTFLARTTQAGDEVMDAILTGAGESESRFGIDEPGDDADPFDLAQRERWTRYEAPFTAATDGARIAAGMFRASLREAVKLQAGAALRDGVAAIGPSIGDAGLYPSAAAWQAASTVLRDALALSAAAAANPGLRLVAGGSTPWPITQRGHPSLRITLVRDPSGEITIHLDGLPGMVEASRLVCALPGVREDRAEAEWLGDVPGLLLTDGPVEDGTATVTIRSLDPDLDDTATRNIALLPPGLAE